MTFVGNRAVLGEQVQLARDDLAIGALHRAGAERCSRGDVGELQRLHVRKGSVRRELDLEILALARFDRQQVPVDGRDGAADPSRGLRVGGGARQSQRREKQCNANLIHRRCPPEKYVREVLRHGQHARPVSIPLMGRLIRHASQCP